ncbi:discoidin domain-containing protein [uncultured Eubacterium sp.]|uniref:discoidin domain-containing protein n=1 Tax=uncultured Eubacterium sp. TaxID=165185 RepID=UPI0032669C36
MKKKIIIIIGCLAVVCAVMSAVVAVGNSSVKMSNKNLTVVTAPDQKEAMENDAFKEEEYVAPEIDGTNVALDGRADANGFNDVYRAPNIIDGSRLTYWEGSQNEESQIISVDLKDSYTIHTVVVGLNPAQIWGKRTQTFKIEASDDGQNYTEVIPSTDYDFDPKTGNQVVIDIDNVKMQYIRLTFTKNTGAVAGQIAELEVYTNDK